MRSLLANPCLPCYNFLMKQRCFGQLICGVDPGPPAENAGIQVGEELISINGDPVVDLIDYEFLTASSRLLLEIKGTDTDDPRTVLIHKEEYEPLGLSFATSLMDSVRPCRNRCMFCFVDQMPKGVRSSLSFKDDDWRLSFIMGNYVTLTNISEQEFSRIISRHVSPLYISVHSTEPDLRRRMMSNPTAGNLMPMLRRLAAAQIRFHCQIVLCPAVNDGEHLNKSIDDLSSLSPMASSVAVVPVGLTRYREGLPPLRGYTRQQAREIIYSISARQEQLLRDVGTRFVFLSDEWYLLAEEPLPSFEEYEDYPQIENGVGIVRKFEEEFDCALSDRTAPAVKDTLHFAGGFSVTGVMTGILKKLEPFGFVSRTYPIRNDWFGGNVTVAGLVTGSDLVSQMKEHMGEMDTLYIPGVMLREREDVFLDDMTLSEVENALDTRIIVFRGGEDLVNKIWMEHS